MKKIASLALLTLSLIFINFYGMKREHEISSSTTAADLARLQPTVGANQVEAFFVPQDNGQTLRQVFL